MTIAISGRQLPQVQSVPQVAGYLSVWAVGQGLRRSASGWIDLVLLVDAILALPRLLVLLSIASLFGSGAGMLTLALGFLYGVAVIRIARATTLDFVARDFGLAAYAMGARQRTIILRDLLPMSLIFW